MQNYSGQIKRTIIHFLILLYLPSAHTSAPLLKVNLTYVKHQVLSKELGTSWVQAGTGQADPAQKFKCTTAARVTININIRGKKNK